MAGEENGYREGRTREGRTRVPGRQNTGTGYRKTLGSTFVMCFIGDILSHSLSVGLQRNRVFQDRVWHCFQLLNTVARELSRAFRVVAISSSVCAAEIEHCLVATGKK